jgi:hypothetical protein
MLTPILLAFISLGITSDSRAFHLVTENQFIFMGSTQTTTTEYWITADKLYQRRGNRIIITRVDKGVQWTIDTQGNTYSEAQLASTENKAPAEDIRTAGFSYEPDFVWTLTEDTEQVNINGRPCGITTAKGLADFADATIKVGLCRIKGRQVPANVNRAVLESAALRYKNPIAFVMGYVSKHSGMSLMSFEATIEPPVSSTMNYRVVVRSIERMPPPVGIFELPAGVHIIGKEF